MLQTSEKCSRTVFQAMLLSSLLLFVANSLVLCLYFYIANRKEEFFVPKLKDSSAVSWCIHRESRCALNRNDRRNAR